MRVGRTSAISDHQCHLRGGAIGDFLPGRGRVLEIGPGSPQYPERGCEVLRVDAQPKAGITAQGDAQALPFRENSFDAVVATEVIEHVRYPYKMLAEIWRVTRPDGRALLSTPNVATFTNRVALMFFGLFPDDKTLHEPSDVGHLHYFTRSFFLQALRASRFDVVREWTQLLPVTPTYYLADTVLERLFPNFAKQVIVECRPRKPSSATSAARS